MAAKGPTGGTYGYRGLTLAMSTGSPLREASSIGSSPLAWRRCILAPSTSFFCLARNAACRSCFLRPSRKASCCWAEGGEPQRGLLSPTAVRWPGRPWQVGCLPLVDVPLGAALPAGAGPEGAALEGEDFSWVVEATGVFCYRGIERGQGVPNVYSYSFPNPRTYLSRGPGWPQAHCVAKADSELLILLPQPPQG